jgi:hypothetical protein
LILGPADSVGRNGRIEETHNGGQTWQLASTGLRVPWRHHIVERFFQVNGDLLATLEWRSILPAVIGVAAVAARQ